ncbi:MAG: hypothetical protein ABI549_05080 [Flavobacterium sp.]|uniref:hypothetical protein n=1 Tax=Flavobacterium sp. TaxID=239 RepID=UPI0032656D00
MKIQKKINIKFLLILLFILHFPKANAQQQDQYNLNTSSYTLSSPEVSNFEKYSLNQINQYTGKVGTSIPVYTIKTGNIVYPINLVYNSSGIKVDQLASDVGLGWNLTMSVVTKTINGRPGDGSGYTNHSEVNYGDPDPANVYDFAPDTYHFYCNGFSTDFFFSDVNTPVELNPQGTKIEFGANSSLVITTNQGIKYTFSDYDTGRIESNDQIGSTTNIAPINISAWHITKIEDLKTGKKIDFVYDTTSSNAYQTVNSQTTLNYSVAQRSYFYYSGSYIDNYDERSFGFSVKTDVQKKRLVKILFDEGELDFNYNNIGIAGQTTIVRNDVYNADCVTQIYLKDKNAANVKSYEFTYDYFTSTSDGTEFNPDMIPYTLSTYRYKRLKLLKFGEIGKPKYKFTYDELVNFPPINSFSTDFLGYYNHSVDGTMAFLSVTQNPISPKLYYYPNNFEKSLLPYPIPGTSPIIIPGYFNREANEYAKTWSLNKVDYPTGGSTEYVYESNHFEEFGQDIKGGGIRIAQQKINDGFGNTRTINYSYLKANGGTSGKLSSTPYFGFPSESGSDIVVNYPSDEITPATITSSGSYVNPANIYWVLFEKSNLNADLNSGTYVGYSRVVESETGAGRKEFTFTSNDLTGYQNNIFRMPPPGLGPNYGRYFPDEFVNAGPLYVDPVTGEESIQSYQFSYERINFMIANSAISSDVFTDNSYKRGKLLTESVFNETNALIKKITRSYSDNIINTYTFHDSKVEYVNAPIVVVSENGHHSGGHAIAQDCASHFCAIAFMVVRKDIKVAQFLPVSQTVSSYDANGTNNNTTTSYSYTSNGFPSSVETRVNNGDINKKKYYYAQDSQMTSEPFVTDLIANNNIATPLKTEIYRNTEKLSEEKTVYAKDATTNNLLLPKYSYAKKGTDTNSALEKKITCDFYDDKGNLIQYTQENGVPVSLIWGYNKTQLLAKIENATYASITSSLITSAQAVSNTGTETNLITALNSIRNSVPLANAMVTSYTHKPLVGISTVTSSRGYTIYYNYDSFGRLINVKDATGNILKENQYNYKPQL